MSENTTTADLSTDELLRLILNRLSDVETRLGALEGKGEDRAKMTRPLLDQLIKEMVETRETLTARLDVMSDRVSGVEKELRSMNRQLEAVAVNWMKTQGEIREHDERLTELERRPN